MTDLTRRKFLGATGAAGVAVAGSTLGVAALADAAEAAEAAEHSSGDGGPIVAQVRDLRRGDITLYVGTREVSTRDRALANRLARAAAAR